MIPYDHPAGGIPGRIASGSPLHITSLSWPMESARSHSGQCPVVSRGVPWCPMAPVAESHSQTEIQNKVHVCMCVCVCASVVAAICVCDLWISLLYEITAQRHRIQALPDPGCAIRRLRYKIWCMCVCVYVCMCVCVRTHLSTGLLWVRGE
jgi:hypothetical protein